MSMDATIMVTLTIVIIWGGLAVLIINALKNRPKN